MYIARIFDFFETWFNATYVGRLCSIILFPLWYPAFVVLLMLCLVELTVETGWQKLRDLARWIKYGDPVI